MEEDEAALLAELRAISAGSAASRFQQEDVQQASNNDDGEDNKGSSKNEPSDAKDETVQKVEETSSSTNAPTPPVTQSHSHSSSKTEPQSNQKEKPLPPWKQQRKPAVNPKPSSEDDVFISAPPPPPPTTTKPLEDESIGSGGGFQNNSTFQGERGGAAEDEDLLAELRAISGQSSAANRFAEKDDEHHQENGGGNVEPSNNDDEPPQKAGPPKPEKAIMPRKTGAATTTSKSTTNNPRDGMDILVSSQSEDHDIVSVLSEPSVFAFQKSTTPSNFKGERGGAAEDADLLAELQAISAKSKSTNRFAEEVTEEEEEDTTQHHHQPKLEETKPEPKRGDDELPPWKRKNAANTTQQQRQSKNNDDDIVVAAPTRPAPAPEMGGFQKTDMPKTFQGDRGGDAEDEELLAELRAISAKTSSTNRFAAEDEEPAVSNEIAPAQEEPSAPEPKKEASLPPWKRKAQKSAPQNNSNVNVVVSAPPPPDRPVTGEPQQPTGGGFQKSSLPNTFQGERGGAAEDEDLLAELRAISSKSSSVNRFGNDEGSQEQVATNDSASAEEESPPAPAKPTTQKTQQHKKEAPLPPWKQKPQKVIQPQQDVEISVSAPPASAADEEPLPATGGFQKSSLPNTFQGERGGAAEDEDLLAELRAISAKSGGTNRFSGQDDDHANESGGSNAPAPAQLKPAGRKAPVKKDADLPPWKRKGPNAKQQQQTNLTEDVDVVVAAPNAPGNNPANDQRESRMGGFQDPSLPNTYKGDRGGAADDEALLAELRAISSGAGGTSRFAEDNGEGTAQAAPSAAPPKMQPPVAPPKPKTSQPTSSGPRIVATQKPSPPGDSESNITIDDFPGALTDKSWKTRKEAYDFLHTTLGNLVAGKEPANDVDASSIVEGLDTLVPGTLGDSNASALDSALQFAVTYADHCRGAAVADQAGAMIAALVKGNSLSSSRPSTVKLSSELVLKLIEVGESGTASAHAVVEVLLSQGLTSRKPKVVITSVGLILEAANAFGAACLPLALVSSSAPKFLSHSNAKVRDNGLKIVAEIARTLGSTSHIQGILDGMKKAQVDQLNAMIEEQPQAAPIGIGFRNQSSKGTSSSPEDALAALESGNAELEAKRFASRPAVNLIAEVAKSEYSTRITHNKWSEKVAALDKVLECGGEKPYKLMEPSSSVKYGPLVNEMKKLLGHTHFAVAGKAMQVLSMLAEGVGEKLFPYLRPLLSTLLGLSKDKKLNKAVASCLDSFFGRILSFDHLLEADALPEALDERKEKNALARSSGLDFLGRCVTRRESAGPRGSLTVDGAQKVADLSVSKLDDSDAGVRKAALGVLQHLQSIEDEDVSEAVSAVIDGLKKTNARAYKTLSRTMKPASNSTKGKGSAPTPPEPTKGPPNSQSRSEPISEKVVAARSAPKPPAPSTAGPVVEETNSETLSLEEALENAARFDIPMFEAPEDEGGVLEGLKSSKWLSRQNAIKELAAFLESEANNSPSAVEKTSGSLLIAVKEHTRGFKETNVNVNKAIMEFFIAVCDYHFKASHPLMSWAMQDVVTLAVDKISDKKLSAIAKGLLADCCLVCAPASVIGTVASKVEQAKSPLPHEECQHWFKSFCNDFGAASLGKGVKDVLAWILTETKSKNAKVKRAALASVGALHVQLGPIFKALLMSQCDDSTRGELEKTVDSHPYDPSCASAEWPKVSIAGKGKKFAGKGTGGNSRDDDDDGGNDMDMGMEIPRFDLFASLPGDCVEQMGNKNGKTAWKLRKQAIDDVDTAVGKCSALIDTSSIRQHVELLRALRDRLSDSQGNLKPLAARVIASLFSVMDKSAQAKLGKIVFAPLITATMTDIKKPMRDASLEALRQATTIPSIEGGGLNEDVLDSFTNALASEINDTALKAAGLPTLLDFVLTFADQLPNLDKVVVARGQSLGEKFAQSTVKCLTSSKSDTRSKAEELLTVCIENEVISLDRIKACTERMKPAQQRSVGPFMAKLARSVPTTKSQGEKENLPTDDAPEPEPQSYSKPASTRSTMRKADRSAPMSRVNANKEDPPNPPSPTGHSHKPRSDIPMHPLIGTSGPAGIEKSRAALRSMTWPEYPEEPIGSDLYYQLKKAWSPILPTSSATCFFPAGGIKNQDDGKPGCDLLAKAILMERADEGVAIEEQLELIFRWIVLVLCSKEHTVGLQALLSAVNDLFLYLQEIKYELSDSEALLFMPFVLEKASLAKGRFKEVYDDLLEVIKAEDVLPPKRLGSVVAVAMLQNASHAKARAMACHDCARCVEQLGLSGIGKKGVLVAAKALDEQLPENRNAALELMELVVARMNGDIQRLARICGSSLSGKARSLVEERWQKRKPNQSASAARPMDDSSRRRSRIPTPQKGSPNEKSTRTSGIPSSSAATSTSKMHNDGNTSSSAILYDELPALNLRHSSGESPYKKRDPNSNVNSSNFNGSADSSGFNFSMIRMDDSVSGNSKSQPSISTYNEPATMEAKPGESSTSAAASLRARLMAIRERSKNPDASLPVTSASDDKNVPNSPVAAAAPDAFTATSSPSKVEDGMRSDELSSSMDSINRLIGKATPLDETDEDLEAAIETSKKLHAALSKQQNVVVGLNAEELTILRQSIVENVDEIIEGLSSLMRFSLDCEVPSRNAGISISLLSVVLATLMALFRDQELAIQVSKERLNMLIRETGTALLDPRFAVSSQNSLDEATSSQVVRAINKLAVQAATGGSRGPSLCALMLLQRELSFESNAFNARLSRVVSKLFTRVIKAEETGPNPWTSSTDIDSLLLSLDEHFHACSKAESRAGANDLEAIAACRNMAKPLVESVINATGGVAQIRDRIESVGIEIVDLARVVAEFDSDTGGQAAEAPTQQDSTYSPSTKEPQKSVAYLVSQLGSAQTEEEKITALSELRQYQLQYGDEDLNNHLEQLSPAFRKFILDQLSQHKSQSEMPDMSERLRLLRTRLHHSSENHVVSATNSPPPVSVPSASTSVSSGSQSLRERLQEAQEKRQYGAVPTDSSSTTGSRAQALRARLLAVKAKSGDSYQ